jgi:deazaflavin-dependent oxidoreductase (nitroreductase family)
MRSIAVPSSDLRSQRDAGPDAAPNHAPRLALASLVLAAPGWLSWILAGKETVPWSALATTIVLVANFGLTRASPSTKRRIVRYIQRFVINPPVATLVWLGILPLGYALIETTGRKSGRRRRTPVGNGRVGDTVWIVAEHGRRAGYVGNLAANPRVRVRLRRGLKPVWVQGTAHVLDDDDPHARQRTLGRRHPLRALNAAVVRVMGTDLVTIRIDLDKPATAPPPEKAR